MVSAILFKIETPCVLTAHCNVMHSALKAWRCILTAHLIGQHSLRCRDWNEEKIIDQQLYLNVLKCIPKVYKRNSATCTLYKVESAH